jgi:hypothetical protein
MPPLHRETRDFFWLSQTFNRHIAATLETGIAAVPVWFKPLDILGTPLITRTFYTLGEQDGEQEHPTHIQKAIDLDGV